LLQISDHAAMASATAQLCGIEPKFLAIFQKHGVPSLRAAPQGLEGLLMIITEQFLSLQAAHTIWQRLHERLKPFSSEKVLACPISELKILGLSTTKAKAFHAACKSDFQFDNLSEAEVSEKLQAIHGVGPWTADIYLLSVLGASDAWPSGDLALRIVIQDLFGLSQRPQISEMVTLAENWRPLRAVAARLLWAHYRDLRGIQQAS
jgi:DNA-3-methyladenine glycosylase II